MPSGKYNYKHLVGKRSNNWKGGISNQPYPFDFTKALKKLIRKRDNYKCQLCGCPQTECYHSLDVHHIDYDKENLKPSNLISLCQPCHMKTNWKRDFWMKLFIYVLKRKASAVEIVERWLK